jgi:oxygen-dependent protoporphyrinogen oxidase
VTDGGTIDVDVAIIGAGISGLACAYACRTLGMRVAVFEAAGESGGCIKSLRVGDFLIEGGPQSLVASPALDDLIDGLGMRSDVVVSAPAAKRRYVLTRRGLIAVPSSPLAMIWSRLLSTGAKLRLMREPFVAPRGNDDDESVASFVRRRAGHEIADVVAGPFVAGVNAGDPEKISVRSMFPVLERMEREHGSVLRGLRKARVAKTRAASFSFSKGNHALPAAIAASLGDSISYRSPVESLEVGRGSAAVAVGGDRPRSVFAERVVIATPAGVAAGFVAPFAEDVARALAAIEYAPVVQLAMTYPRKAIGVPLDGYGFLASADADARILGAVWNSVAFPMRSTVDDVLITAFVGGARDRAMTARTGGELETIVDDALRRAMKIAGGRALGVATFRFDDGIPQYNLGHDERLQSIETGMARHPAVALCGNYLRGLSVGDCVRQARELALRFAHAKRS